MNDTLTTTYDTFPKMRDQGYFDGWGSVWNDLFKKDDHLFESLIEDHASTILLMIEVKPPSFYRKAKTSSLPILISFDPILGSEHAIHVTVSDNHNTRKMEWHDALFSASTFNAFLDNELQGAVLYLVNSYYTETGYGADYEMALETMMIALTDLADIIFTAQDDETDTDWRELSRQLQSVMNLHDVYDFGVDGSFETLSSYADKQDENEILGTTLLLIERFEDELPNIEP